MAGPAALVPAYGQTNNAEEGRIYTVGNVEMSGHHTLIVRADDCKAFLYMYDSYTVKPPAIAVGARVRVFSSPTSESDVRRAISVRPDTSTPAPADPNALPCEPVRPQVLESQREIERDGRVWHWGLRGGVGLDPEVLVVGAQAQFGPLFRYVLVRPGFDFGWGNAVQTYAINLDLLLRWPGTTILTKWYPYVGAGPHLTFVELNAGHIDSDFHSIVGLNIVAGVQSRGGVFLESRVSLYSKPTSTLKLLVGYNF